MNQEINFYNEALEVLIRSSEKSHNFEIFISGLKFEALSSIMVFLPI